MTFFEEVQEACAHILMCDLFGRGNNPEGAAAREKLRLLFLNATEEQVIELAQRFSEVGDALTAHGERNFCFARIKLAPRVRGRRLSHGLRGVVGNHLFALGMYKVHGFDHHELFYYSALTALNLSFFVDGADAVDAGELELALMFDALEVWAEGTPSGDIVVATQKLTGVAHRFCFAADFTHLCHI